MTVFQRTALVVSVLGVTLSGMAFATANASAATACTVKAVGTKNTTGNTNSRFTLNGDGTVTAAFTVTGHDCEQAVTLASWQAPDAIKGRPYDQQKLYKHVTGTFGEGTYKLTVQLPDCYYQIDLVTGTSPTGVNGTPVYETERMLGSLHGGTQKCEETPPTTPETPTTPQTPVTPASTREQPTTLPNTGTGSNILLAALGATVAGAAFQYIRQLRARRSLNQ